ncbi:glutamate synthase large subunit [Dermatophilus congolensis]|uniref:glutamate synthase large subunit n=1 Tax=Dermatophilus congolensis TaxID=1863 RepID=UPI001AAF0D38|nr:glutamate synthase large subunit [Dermatophilus congolensis]MBO3131847.1 glutamate synthase large subunit [Dermatophilus congolensis]MBO3133996.1 glutamate synthase large subunit [Dermatophilus congolensis]MBO3136227.1 glutamate synthase large subunit [Dermatophilus congolensis]MBO3138473.1 glutamate synthase large subunit [Dermatophilus congolensis]
MSVLPFSALPERDGLYDPRHEHDACGVAMVATLRGTPGHDIVRHAVTALVNLDHRGATGADPLVGDGAGILMQVPDRFFRDVAGVELPERGHYVAGFAYLPADLSGSADARAGITRIASEEGLEVLGWREVPTNPDVLGAMSREVMPSFWQVFLVPSDEEIHGIALERLAFCLRKRAEHELDSVYFPSLSARTHVYKGMLTTMQLPEFFPDLSDERVESELAIVHSRFSTNTFPSWTLAHPFRLIAHNGEINTVRGNRNWMRARESLLASDAFGPSIERLFPICTPGASDSASFDEVLELLHLAGRSLPHAMLMMIPEAWENNTAMPADRRAFYQFHSMFMEPWDGPASVTFTDGSVLGAVLDRNGLRPSRYWVTDDGLVVLGSEAGLLDIDEERIVTRGRVAPGHMFLLDTAEGRIIPDEEIKSQLASAYPYQEYVKDQVIHLADLPEREHVFHTPRSVARRQQAFGYTQEDLRLILQPMALNGAEAIGSMGTDTPMAVLSSRPRLLFDYFQQLFAQVTNPPLDAIREEMVTSLQATLGPQVNPLATDPQHAHQIAIDFPILDNDDLAKIVHIDADSDTPGEATVVVSGLYEVAGGGAALKKRLDLIFNEVTTAISRGARYVVISDRDSDANHASIPSLLLTAAVHHHLVRTKDRMKVSLIVEAGDVREVHHVATLIGYGAAAVNPYLAIETVEDMVRRGAIRGVSAETASKNVIKALGKGLLKVMSKMGISTAASYRGAQIFECIGLAEDLVEAYFTGTTTVLGGIGLEEIAREVADRHAVAYPRDGISPTHRLLPVGGEYQWRREGPPHLFDPETVFRLQHGTRERRYDIFKQYTTRVNEQAERLMTLRGLFRLRTDLRPSVPIDEVEPVSEIVKRFSTGAMSYGSISREAHETLAIAMNRLGGRSNTGEGGEDPERLQDPQRCSAIKQVASGRFGVTSLYLSKAKDIQIKMAQGAKPGEGGQLPGPKVYPWVATTRHSTPGVGLISPPPHHDIYSIEDLKQLIHDLKNANPVARVHVKLVSEIGVGTVAAGVSKAFADVVLISGHDGGTGAAPLTSLKHAGGPWELGLAETQQTLVKNELRDRIVVQVDGQLKTGRDVVIAALLGAEEFGFATAPLVVSGCVMMRACQKDTCPVGIATQNPELRQRFSGKPEFVVTFFEYIAQEVRELLAELGFRSIDEAIGQASVLETQQAVDHWKASGLDLSPILREAVPVSGERRAVREQQHGLERALDNSLSAQAREAIDSGGRVVISSEIRNTHRTVGTMLGHEVTAAHPFGMDEDSIHVDFTGCAGQSFGAFVPRGVTLALTGEANDYVAKGLSGGRVVVRPARQAAATDVIAGNVIGYGATSGEIFLRGTVGERFCVRNSGAEAVVEGVGDHGLEYMTGGVALILGPTGRNLAAGMSGGLAFVLDLDPGVVNGEFVDVVPLRESDDELVLDLLRRHVEQTGSPLADSLVADWAAARARFSLILPRAYQRVLDVRAEAEREGLDVDGSEVWGRILEVSHG